jgi:hypothetical protein
MRRIAEIEPEYRAAVILLKRIYNPSDRDVRPLPRIQVWGIGNGGPGGIGFQVPKKREDRARCRAFDRVDGFAQNVISGAMDHPKSGLGGFGDGTVKRNLRLCMASPPDITARPGRTRALIQQDSPNDRQINCAWKREQSHLGTRFVTAIKDQSRNRVIDAIRVDDLRSLP